MMRHSGVVVVAACCCLVIATASPTSSELERFEAKLASVMDGLNQKDSIGIYGNMISLEKMAVEEDRDDGREADVDPLMKRIDEFLRIRRLQIRFPSDGSSADYFSRALGEKSVDFELRGLIHGASEGENFRSFWGVLIGVGSSDKLI